MNSLRMSFWIVPPQLVLRHALLLGRHDVAREHRQHGAVHGHRHGHLVERDAVEQDLHVLDGIDRHARLADVAHDARMIGIVAAMRREIERHRQAHLARREIGAIELVALLGGREAGVLAHRPGTAGIHRRLGPARERRETGHACPRSRGSRGRPRYRAASPRCPRASSSRATTSGLSRSSLAASFSQSARVFFGKSAMNGNLLQSGPTAPLGPLVMLSGAKDLARAAKQVFGVSNRSFAALRTTK